MSGQRLFASILFVVFFTVGLAAVSAAILSSELIESYKDRELLRRERATVEKLRILNDDYNALLSQVQGDPNMLKRIAPIALGESGLEPNTVRPTANPQALEEARKALIEDTADTQTVELPNWLKRVQNPMYRRGLFVSGAILILISFACFRGKSEEAEVEA
jgi:hypothetical protein